MNPTAVAYAIQLMSALPSLVQAGVDITRTVQNATRSLEDMQAQGRNPTPGEWAALNDEIKRLRGELHR